MNLGLLYAIAANLIWGLVFLGPIWVPGATPVQITGGRYTFYGFFAVLCLVWVWQRTPPSHAIIRNLKAWRAAAGLALLGNFVYFLCVSAAVQSIGIALPTMIVGMIPVTVPVIACLVARRWPTGWLWLAMTVMAGGIVLANWRPLDGTPSTQGVAFAVAALLCWSAYALLNQRAMRRYAPGQSLLWASLQGAAGLPFGLALFWIAGGTAQPHLAALLPVWIVLGVVCSGIANVLWNLGSARLPSTLLGPMIAFETLSGLACAWAYDGKPWPMTAWLGVMLLLTGVMLAVHGERKPAPPAEAISTS
ncbi:MAG: DMT family transporter [Stagnimonas sp.]|nr:DMT family transporter [Stagnimonas sp.]